VLSISVSAPRDLKEITYITDKFIKQNLETVQDVGSVTMLGTRKRAVQVTVGIAGETWAFAPALRNALIRGDVGPSRPSVSPTTLMTAVRLMRGLRQRWNMETTRA